MLIQSNCLFLLPGITVEDVKKCLGYHLDANIVYKNIQANFNVDSGKCENIYSREKCKYALDLRYIFCLRKDNTSCFL